MNSVSFSSFLIDDDWQEAHERLAELEKPPAAVNEQTGNGERDEMDLLGDHERKSGRERLSKMVIENELEDPAITGAVQTRPVLSKWL